MAQHTQQRPSMPIPQSFSSASTLRSEATPFKTTYSNQISTDVQNSSGKPLKKPAGSIIALIFEGFLCLIALCFIALAVVALCIRNRPTGDKLGSTMEESMKLGPTLYPILFAALLSRSLKSLGRYFAQRSVRMSTLWALMNTNSTADPLLHIVSMPASVLVWVLLVLWAMSPLGGQSTIRLLYKTNTTDITHPELRYWDSGPLGNMLVRVGIMEANDGSFPWTMRDMYSASLMQSVDTKSGPLDQWGNVKIPRLEAGNASQADSAGWMPIKSPRSPETFTSLLGMPIVSLPALKKQGDLNFTIEMTYVELSNPKTFYREKNGTNNDGKGMNIECIDCNLDYQTFFVRSQKLMGLPTDNYEDEGLDINMRNLTEPLTLRFNNTLYNTSVTTCQVTQRMVEAFIECEDGSCEATKVRPSTTDHRPKNFTSFDYWAWIVLELITGVSWQDYKREVMWGGGSSTLFLNNSGSFPTQSGRGGAEVQLNMNALDPELFTTRASILLNTGIEVFMAPTAFSGQLPTNLSMYGPAHLPGNGLQVTASEQAYKSFNISVARPPDPLLNVLSADAPFVGAATNATFVRYTEVYRPDYVWVVILIITSIILFAVGIAGIVVRLKTLAPNVFDPVVGLTYNNPYISANGKDYDPLDADERARLLSRKTVQLGEVDDYKGIKAVLGEAGYVTPLRLGVPYH